MVKKDMHMAELKLNPRHLGPIEVKIAMSQDQVTTVHMSASHGTTREALEAAIPRLREMLNESGLTQVDVNVSQHSNQQRQQAQDDNGHAPRGSFDTALQHANEHAELDENEHWHKVPIYGANRILDAFA